MFKNKTNHDVVLSILYWFKSKDHIKMLVNMLSKSENKEMYEILENVCYQIMSHEIE